MNKKIIEKLIAPEQCLLNIIENINKEIKSITEDFMFEEIEEKQRKKKLIDSLFFICSQLDKILMGNNFKVNKCKNEISTCAMDDSCIVPCQMHKEAAK